MSSIIVHRTVQRSVFDIIDFIRNHISNGTMPASLSLNSFTISFIDNNTTNNNNNNNNSLSPSLIRTLSLSDFLHDYSELICAYKIESIKLLDALIYRKKNGGTISEGFIGDENQWKTLFKNADQLKVQYDKKNQPENKNNNSNNKNDNTKISSSTVSPSASIRNNTSYINRNNSSSAPSPPLSSQRRPSPPDRPDHFISFRINSPMITNHLLAIQSSLTAINNNYSKLLIPVGSLHITVGLLVLNDNEKLNKAKLLFENAAIDIRHCVRKAATQYQEKKLNTGPEKNKNSDNDASIHNNNNSNSNLEEKAASDKCNQLIARQKSLLTNVSAAVHRIECIDRRFHQLLSPVSVNFRDLGSFSNEVLFAKIVDDGGHYVLKQLAAYFDSLFKQFSPNNNNDNNNNNNNNNSGSSSSSSDNTPNNHPRAMVSKSSFTPHLTIAKASRDKDFIRNKRNKTSNELKLNPSMLPEFLSMDFGCESLVQLDLCAMSGPKDETGYYPVIASVKL